MSYARSEVLVKTNRCGAWLRVDDHLTPLLFLGIVDTHTSDVDYVHSKEPPDDITNYYACNLKPPVKYR